jgi:hypothetical protein
LHYRGVASYHKGRILIGFSTILRTGIATPPRCPILEFDEIFILVESIRKGWNLVGIKPAMGMEMLLKSHRASKVPSGPPERFLEVTSHPQGANSREASSIILSRIYGGIRKEDPEFHG